MLTHFFLLIHFWLNHPALLYGVAFLLGISCSLTPSLFLLLPCSCFLCPFIVASIGNRNYLKHLFLILCVFLTGWMYASFTLTFPTLPKEGLKGHAHIHIQRIQKHSTIFGEQKWHYSCLLLDFIPENSSASIATSIPCSLTLPLSAERPLAHTDYWVASKLVQTEKGRYLLKISSKTQWNSVDNTLSFAEWRHTWKRKVENWIHSRFHFSTSASFLSGLATGDFQDEWMRQQFSRFGLQHVLAVSGFHFAIVAGFLSLLFRFIFPPLPGNVCLIFLLTVYAFFLGPQPSILRAWLMCSLVIIGKLLEKETTALNSIGIALLGILGYHPLLLQDIGFQLSFATTVAILLFYPLTHLFLCHTFEKKTLREVRTMNGLNQHAYCLLAFLREGMALSLALNLFALPLTLYTFHEFPLMSGLYNLFFPFLASISLILFILGTFFAFVPFLSKAIDAFNDFYTHFILQLTYQVPEQVDAYIFTPSFSSESVLCLLTLFALIGIIYKQKASSEKQGIAFTFI